MSSSLALKVYNSTAADSTQTDEASASNSSSVHSACAVDFLCIAEACNQTGFVDRANAQVGDGAHYERHTNAQNMTVIRTYESESTILRTIGSVVSEMPKNSEAIFGWALVDMNYEDSVGHKCPVYAESEASFARTRAVRQVMLKREGYELRKLLHI
ncbi:hypothetical protein V5799_033001 [Amblyomma americanum]|uniref:Uncharacterized protein n=1 Tax=Amblyomma americanum TaxID=6943 RepID=A0AAQ4DPJ9_AMBAM